MGFFKWLDKKLRESNEKSERIKEWKAERDYIWRKEREIEEQREREKWEREREKSESARCCENCCWYNCGCTHPSNKDQDEYDYIEYIETHDVLGRRVALYASEKACEHFERK